MNLNIYHSENEVLQGLAEYFINLANASVADHGQFSVALSGGNSPKKLYEMLASPAYGKRVDWTKVHFFFGDERYVPHTDPQSNYLMAKKAILQPLELSYRQIFPVNTSVSPEEAAARYTNDINHYFAGFEPRFDLVLLGLGDNSHTASLFPHTPVLLEKSASVKEVFLKDQEVYRITMTAPLINLAHHIAFLVFGLDKAAAVQHVIEGKTDIENYPAQLIRPKDGDVQWFMDRSAASKLKKAG